MPTDTTATAATTVFTLADLPAWDRPGTHLAVLGHPIAHSLSPLMHNAALAAMSARDPRYRHWRYHRFDIPPADLPRALALFHEKKFHGLNLTVPHKVIAFDTLAAITPDAIDPAARPIGAVNTLTRAPRGWRATNTDGHGLAAAIRETLALDLAGAHILLLGAGGAARGAAVECLHRRCATLTIANRTRANLDALLEQLRPLADASQIPLRAFEPEPEFKIAQPFLTLPGYTNTAPTGMSVLPSLHPALIINATSLGLRPTDPSPIDLAALTPRPLAVFDMIYNPPQTPLLAQAAALRIPRANGLAMLVHQGARSLEIWTGEKIPVEAMSDALR